VNRVVAHGVEVVYDRAGSGDPIVLAHGGAVDARSWIFQEPLTDEFDLIVWDEPGNGRSEDLAPGWGLTDSAEALAGLIQELEVQPAHVGGLSWGGVVALELYRRHPELVGTLILAGSYAGWKGSLPGEEVAARVSGFEQSLAHPEERGQPFPGLFKVDPLPHEIELVMTEMQADVRIDTLRALVPAVAGADLSDVLPTVDVPVLLIWGADDVRSPLETVGRQFESSIRDVEMVVIPDCGHVGSMERPHEFNRAVREFCRAHPVSVVASE
jgi:pimeloyl-ACP methyl ester carboxylesterase